MTVQKRGGRVSDIVSTGFLKNKRAAFQLYRIIIGRRITGPRVRYKGDTIVKSSFLKQPDIDTYQPSVIKRLQLHDQLIRIVLPMPFAKSRDGQSAV